MKNSAIMLFSSIALFSISVSSMADTNPTTPDQGQGTTVQPGNAGGSVDNNNSGMRGQRFHGWCRENQAKCQELRQLREERKQWMHQHMQNGQSNPPANTPSATPGSNQ